MRVRSFTKGLFLSVVGVFIMLAVCFAFYQHHREKEYKIDIMHSRLQMYNYELMQSLDTAVYNPAEFATYMNTHPIEGLRVTVVDVTGRVVADSRQYDVGKMGNHLDRTEIRKALKEGNGYDIKRSSETLSEDYFYSATFFRDEGIIVRAAVPYNARLAHSLEADNRYLYYVALITLMLGLVLYRNTHRIGEHIRCLRNFAVKAERGEPLDKELQMKLPDDELGEISHIIIVLYWKLKHSEEDKVRLKRQLTQNAAHELKTPAAGIQGFLETIINNPDMPEEKRRHFLERCYAQSVRMSNLLLDMAALTKLDEESRFRKTDDVDVRSVLFSVLDDFCLDWQNKGVEVVTSLPTVVKVKGDASQIDSVFRNLFDNVVAYAAGADKVTVECTEASDVYRFAVSDNGTGVDPQHLSHIFERFYRVDKGRSRKLGGTGLGLAIVKNIVMAHGGSVSAETTPGGGLTVMFTLKKL